MPLTNAQVKAVKPDSGGKIVKMSDGGGLQLHVLPTGTKSWRLAYRWGGKQKTLTLGNFPEVSLAEARAAREAAKSEMRAGREPGKSRRESGRTFNDAADLWLEKMSTGNASLKESTLEARRYQLEPLRRAFGDWDLEDVRPKDILHCLLALRASTPSKAERCRIVVGQVFRYAVSADLMQNDPTTALRGAMPAHRDTHHAAILDPKGIGELMRAIRAHRGHPSVHLALRLAPHVALRSAELRGLRWPMVDFEEKVVTIPAEAMKGGRHPHMIVMSRQVEEILQQARALTSGDGLVFPGARDPTRMLSDATLNAALQRLGYQSHEMTPHGFRTIASTILHDAFPRESLVIEAMLAHGDENRVRGAYNRAQYIEWRRGFHQYLSDRLDELAEKHR